MEVKFWVISKTLRYLIKDRKWIYGFDLKKSKFYLKSLER